MLKQYKVFVSHAWQYSEPYNRVVQMLNNAGYFKWANYSVPRHDPIGATNRRNLEEGLKSQIRPVQVVLVLAGMYAHHRDWIQWEMDFAKLLRKPMVGIVPWGQERTPVAVQQAVDEMVGWNTATIIRAIRQHSL